MRLAPAVVIVFFLSLGLAMSCEAASDFSVDMERLSRLRESLNVQADRIEHFEAEQRIVASGAVRIVLGNRVLLADEVSVDLDEQELVASGHVVLTEGLNRLEGDRIQYNYRTNLGIIENGKGTLESGVSFSGVEIRREAERQYALKEARFTGCRACQPEPKTPDWEFRATQATIYQDEWIASRNTSFWVKGIPALFSPVVALPIGPRRTGFLIPRFGYSGTDGFIVRQPFFWAISRSQDVTFTPIYRTERGFEIQGEYRYVIDERSAGQLSARYLYDLLAESGGSDRGDVKWLHEQHLSPTWVFKADANYISDRRLNRDFVDNSATERTQRVLPSNIFLTQTTSQYMLLGLLSVTEDLTGVGEERLSRLPEVRFQWLPSPIFALPVLGEVLTSAVYFERSGADNTGRFDLHPVLHLPLAMPWLNATTSVGLRETAYSLAARPDGDTNRVLLDIRQRLASPFLRRFDDPGLGFARLTHIVEPSIQYEYVPSVDQQSLLQFDAVDFVSPQNRLTYRLDTRLMGRVQRGEGVQNYEVATLRVAQSLNLQPRTQEFSNVYLEALTPERIDQAVKNPRPLPNGFTRATERRLSNLVAYGAIRPLPAMALFETVAVNVEQVDVEGVNSGVELQFRDLVTLQAGHSYLRDRQVDGVVGRLSLRATQHIWLDMLTRYDIGTSKLLENTANLRFVTCCWEVGLRYTYLGSTTERTVENSVQVVFDLRMPTMTTAR
jgi:LPS-assembly protein